ncbi:MAG: type II toxin-antitoxin system RelE/ParE family toxin [Planctomycetota bacterium]
MQYSFHPAAERELLDAVRFYEQCNEGLGVSFAKEIYKAIQTIVLHPSAWAPLSPNTRRCLIPRFPYGIIYSVTTSDIYIIAIMHLNKKPHYWKRRLTTHP